MRGTAEEHLVERRVAYALEMDGGLVVESVPDRKIDVVLACHRRQPRSS